MKNIMKFLAFTIVIGVLALAFNNAFGNQTVLYITKEQINLANNTHFYIWKFDFWKYIDNFQLSLTNLSILQFDMPTRQWDNNWNLADWGTTLGNNMLVILDYIIMVINILLYPLKVGAYLIRNILAILGINTNYNDNNNGLGWLVYFVENILARISIPYI